MTDHATKCTRLIERRERAKQQRRKYSDLDRELVLTRCRQIRAETDQAIPLVCIAIIVALVPVMALLIGRIQ